MKSLWQLFYKAMDQYFQGETGNMYLKRQKIALKTRKLCFEIGTIRMIMVKNCKKGKKGKKVVKKRPKIFKSGEELIFMNELLLPLFHKERNTDLF